MGFVFAVSTAAELGKVMSDWNAGIFFFAFFLEIWNNLSCLAKADVFDRKYKRIKKGEHPRRSTAETLGVSLMPRIWLEMMGKAFVPGDDQRARPFRTKAGKRLESKGESLRPVGWVAAMAALVRSGPVTTVHSPMSTELLTSSS